MTHDSTETTGTAVKPHLLITVLAVRDLNRSRGFYTAVFDWPIILDLPVLVTFKTPGGHELMLYQSEAFGINTGRKPEILPAAGISGTELYIHVADLSETISRFEALKARELSGRAARSWGDEVAYYADPDGNVLAVAQPLPGSANNMA